MQPTARSGTSLSQPAAGRKRVALLAPLVGAIALGAVVATSVVAAAHRQPKTIEAALESFRSGEVPADALPSRPAPDLESEGLGLVGSGHRVLGGLAVDVFTYRTPGGSRVLVLLSSHPFPRARHASTRSGPVRGWRATVDDDFLACANRPVPYLVIGPDRRLVDRADVALSDAFLSSTA